LWAEKKPSTSKLQGYYHISLFKKATLLKPDLKVLLQKNKLKQNKTIDLWNADRINLVVISRFQQKSK
jgi:hypothetical protein